MMVAGLFCCLCCLFWLWYFVGSVVVFELLCFVLMRLKVLIFGFLFVKVLVCGLVYALSLGLLLLFGLFLIVLDVWLAWGLIVCKFAVLFWVGWYVCVSLGVTWLFLIVVITWIVLTCLFVLECVCIGVNCGCCNYVLVLILDVVFGFDFFECLLKIFCIRFFCLFVICLCLLICGLIMLLIFFEFVFCLCWRVRILCFCYGLDICCYCLLFTLFSLTTVVNFEFVWCFVTWLPTGWFV